MYVYTHTHTHTTPPFESKTSPCCCSFASQVSYTEQTALDIFPNFLTYQSQLVTNINNKPSSHVREYDPYINRLTGCEVTIVTGRPSCLILQSVDTKNMFCITYPTHMPCPHAPPICPYCDIRNYQYHLPNISTKYTHNMCTVCVWGAYVGKYPGFFKWWLMREHQKTSYTHARTCRMCK